MAALGRSKWVDGYAAGKIQEFRTIELLNRRLRVVTLIGMRLLFHPSIEEITVEGILHALADPVRVAMYADIVAQGCPQACSNFPDGKQSGDPEVNTLTAFQDPSRSRLDSERAPRRGDATTSRAARSWNSAFRD